MKEMNRRTLLRYSGLGAAMLGSGRLGWAAATTEAIHVNLNESAFGPSPTVLAAITGELSRVSRYATEAQAQAFTQQIAEHERVLPEQVILGEILGGLGLYLGSEGGPGGEFVYSVPGYLALIDAASHVGGVGVPVPLNARFENDLPAIEAKLSPRTRAVYLVNPHNPTGTSNDPVAFQRFLRSASAQAPVIVDEAYMEYTSDAEMRSAVSLVRDGANVLVFRTFDKIHGLAGVPIGYTLAPAKLVAALHGGGLGDAEGLGRLNLAAASAALKDRQHVLSVRTAVAEERTKWLRVLDDLHLPHTRAQASFVFFDTGHPQEQLVQKLRAQDIVIARAFPPYTTWARITIGLPEENLRVQNALREALASRSKDCRDAPLTQERFDRSNLA